MSDVVLNASQLAKRWKCSSSTISALIEEGKIKPCKALPKHRFYLRYIEELEVQGLDDPLSPMERRRLQAKIESLEKTISFLEDKLNQIQVLTKLKE